MPGETEGTAARNATINRIANIVLIVILSVAGLYFAAPFLIPLVLAALLAMLLNKGSSWLERRGVSRALASLIPVLLFIGAAAMIGALLSWQINRMADNFGQMREQVGAKIESLLRWISETFGVTAEEQKKMVTAQGKEAPAGSGSWLFSIVNTLTTVAVNTVLVLVYTYLLIYFRSHLRRSIVGLVPENKRTNAERIIRKSAVVSGHYLMGLFTMVGFLWIMYSIGFSIIGLEGALLFAVLCGLLEIVPFFGNLMGSFIALLAAIAQGGDAGMVIGVVVVYLTVQFLQTYILEPLVVGQRVNINPLFTILGLVAGELLWGIAGMALAIPIVAIVKIVCDNVPGLRAYGLLIGPEDKGRSRTSPLASLKRRLERK